MLRTQAADPANNQTISTELRLSAAQAAIRNYQKQRGLTPAASGVARSAATASSPVYDGPKLPLKIQEKVRAAVNAWKNSAALARPSS